MTKVIAMTVFDYLRKYSLVFLFLISGMSFSFAQLTLVEWNFPNNPDDSLVDISTPVNAAKYIHTVGATPTAVGAGFSQSGATTRAAFSNGWDNGNGSKWWEIEFNTSGYYNLELSSKQISSATGPRDFKAQYKIGAAGTWTDIPGATAIAITAVNNWTTPTAILPNIPLPIACNNQTSVYIRWIMTTNVSEASGVVASGGNSRIDDINISANSPYYFRSVSTGNWNQTFIWELSPDFVTWAPADMPPNQYADTIVISSGTIVSISASSRVDEVAVESGATLNNNTGTLTINDGPGIDLFVDGTFNDASSNAVTWVAGATWASGNYGTFVKSSSSNIANWQNFYYGNINSIPATATWIINKVSASNPSIVTLGACYPNLIIQNNFGLGTTWVTSGTSTFQVVGGFPTIKGNLDIGGTGTGYVDFLNANTFASPTLVLGNLVVRSGNTLRNYGTGIEVQGDITVDGSLNYSAGTGARKIIMSGSNPQTINGSGTFNIYYLEVNKSANHVTLNCPLIVDNQLQLTSGKVITNVPNGLGLIDNAISNAGNDTSFVDGPMAKTGDDAFVFPIGKNSVWAPIGMSAPSSALNAVGAEYFFQTFPDTSALLPLNNVSKIEYWNLVPFISTPLSISLYWKNNVRSGIDTYTSDLRVAWYDGSDWNDEGQSALSGGSPSGNVTSNSFSASGYFTFGSLAPEINPLPVELLTFSAICINSVVDLNWSTASEINNDYFTLERSGDGKDFTPLMNIPGAGNSTSLKNYFEKDLQPIEGISYYRLKQTDYDGQFSYSKIIPVKVLQNNFELNNIYADKQNQIINLQMDAGFSSTVQLNVFSAAGQKIYSENVQVQQGGNFLRLPASQLSRGVYTIQLIAKNECVVKKFFY